MKPIKSSNIISVGYSAGDLYVEYPSGIYKYKNVPEELYNKLMAAESLGTFMNTFIKGNYEYSKLPA